jgi:predicted XRE-type DNA-binding protein
VHHPAADTDREGIGVERLVRIGDKLIDTEKITQYLHEILALRASGLSQQETAERLGVDRSFISRLESLGELRKGRRVALIGFPVANKAELEQVARESGVEFILLLTNEERWEYAQSRGGAQLLNEIVVLLSRLREFDAVVFLGSDMRIRMVRGLLEDKLVSWELGTSPLVSDCHVEPERLRVLLSAVTGRD